MNTKIENERSKYCEENGIDYNSLSSVAKRKLTNDVKELMGKNPKPAMPVLTNAPVPEPEKVQEQVVIKAPVVEQLPEVIPVAAVEPVKEVSSGKEIIRLHFNSPNSTYILPHIDKDMGLTDVSKRPQNAYLRIKECTAYFDMSKPKDVKALKYMKSRRGFGTDFYILNDEEKSAETLEDMAKSLRILDQMSVPSLHSLFTDLDYNRYQLNRGETDKAVLKTVAIKAGKVLK